MGSPRSICVSHLLDETSLVDKMSEKSSKASLIQYMIKKGHGLFLHSVSDALLNLGKGPRKSTEKLSEMGAYLLMSHLGDPCINTFAHILTLTTWTSSRSSRALKTCAIIS
ncbi:hypothetical protein KCU89_g50, partial [Aureobasidium melanogenum]